MNIRRVPGVIYQHKFYAGCIFVIFIVGLYAVHQAGIVCSNNEVEKVIQDVCFEYFSKRAVGSLCRPLCEDNMVSAVSCIPNHAGKQIVFKAKYDEAMVVFKSAYTSAHKWNETDTRMMLNEDDFKMYVRDLVINKLNVTLSSRQLETLSSLDFGRKKKINNRSVEIANLQTLLQSQEYLLTALFSEQELFPQLYGNCGHLYAVENLNVPRVNSYFLADSEEIWWQRLNVAVLILDLLEELETNFPDPLHLCDIKFDHFGLSNVGRLKVTDLDEVHTNTALQRILSQGQPCTTDAECDLFDCKSICNQKTKSCDLGIASNNLQAICEKLFIGWTMGRKVIVPGLLMSEHTPPSLAALLRQCAENGRAPVPEDIRQRLYTTLTEMEQSMAQKFHAT